MVFSLLIFQLAQCPQGPSMLSQMAGFPSFLWLNNIPSYVYRYHIFFIHTYMDGYLGCFHVLAIVINTAVMMGVQIIL